MLTTLIDKFTDSFFGNIGTPVNDGSAKKLEVGSIVLDSKDQKKIKNRVFILSTVFAILMTPIYFYGMGWIYDVKPKNHMLFLQGGDPYSERLEVRDRHLQKANEQVGKYEVLSSRSRVEQYKLLYKNIDSDEEQAKALRFLNRTQDIITKLMEFGKFYVVLAHSDELNAETQEALLLMYEGWFDILSADLLGDSKKFTPAYEKYLKVYDQLLRAFPDNIQNDVRIEVLNVLTYIEARQKKADKQEAHMEEARALLAAQDEDPITYRRKYYWIDLSEFMDAIQNYEADRADVAFKELNVNLDPEFLKAKLLQHRGIFLEEGQRNLINVYIEKIII